MTDFIAAYERHLRYLDRSPNTITTYIRTLRQADRELPGGLVSANLEELEEWIFSTSPARRGGGERGKNTRSHYVRILKGFGRWTTDPKTPQKYRLDFDATADLPKILPAKRKARPTREDLLAALIRQVPTPCLAWILLGAYAGLRCIEIGRLDRADITQERIWVRGKGDKERFVPTHPQVWEAVKDLPPGPIAVDAGVRLTATQVAHRGNYRIMKAVGPRITSMHKLRHRFATVAYDGTRDLVAVQELCGHSSPATTRNYVEVNRDRMAAAVASLPVAV